MFEEELQNLQRSPLHNVERTDRFTHSDESVLMIITKLKWLPLDAGRRAYDTWDEGRKKQRPTTAKNLDPTLKSACSNGQLTRRDNTDRSFPVLLAAEAPPPNNMGVGGRVQNGSPNNPTTRADY